jgi:CheY-like chemotaxis protein
MHSILAARPDATCCYVLSLWAALAGLVIDRACGWRLGALLLFGDSLAQAGIPLVASARNAEVRRRLIFVLHALFCTAVAIFGGGYASPLLIWLLLIPLVPLVCGDARAAVLWTVFCALFVMVIVFTPSRSWSFGPREESKVILAQIGPLGGVALVSLLGWIALVNDAERRKQLQSVLDEVHFEAIAKRDLLAKMSHELRTPLTAILGFAEELAPQVVGASGQQAADAIQRNSRAMLATLEDLLEWGRLECGSLPLQRTSNDTAKLLAAVQTTLGELNSPQVRQVTLEFDGPVPEQIVTDQQLFSKAIVKAAAAALQATGRGALRLVAHCDLECERLEVDIGPLDQTWQAEELRKLFDRKAASTSVAGGFSLAVSHGLACLLGGTVQVIEKEQPHTAALQLSIATGPLAGVPLITPSALGPTGRDSAAHRGRAPRLDDCRILLVEDSPDTKALMTFLLARAGAEVQAVENGQAAIAAALSAQARGNPFDIVLMDMQMPIMDGHEATKRLRKEGYTRPIIAFTAQSVEYTRDKCLRAGCDDYITKPSRSHTLIELVGRYARRNLEEVMQG